MTTSSQTAPAGLRLNLGCGQQVVEGWLNVDYAVGARFAKVPGFAGLNRRLGLFHLDWSPRVLLHDLRRPLPWATGTVAAVYSSHTLEHLDAAEGLALLRECHRVLVPGGVLRVVVPDLKGVVDAYVSGALKATAFLEVMGTGYGAGKQGLKRHLAPFIESPHRCMYDAPAMIEAFAEAGLSGEARAPFQSGLADIAGIEQEDRTRSAVIVEARR